MVLYLNTEIKVPKFGKALDAQFVLINVLRDNEKGILNDDITGKLVRMATLEEGNRNN